MLLGYCADGESFLAGLNNKKGGGLRLAAFVVVRGKSVDRLVNRIYD
jgi:hypothetical protein